MNLSWRSWVLRHDLLILFSSTVFVLLLLSISGAVRAQSSECDSRSFATSNHNCALSRNCRNVTCHDLSMEGGNSLDYLSVSVDNCLDPVGATLVVSDEGECSGRFLVNGVGELRKQLQFDGWLQLSAVFSRNASHLHFQAIPSSLSMP